MNEILELLYKRFYIPLPLAEPRQQITQAQQLLIQRLDLSDRKLLLQIIDGGDQIADELSLDSFICGFLLAYRLGNELQQFQKERPLQNPFLDGDALSYMQE